MTIVIKYPLGIVRTRNREKVVVNEPLIQVGSGNYLQNDKLIRLMTSQFDTKSKRPTF